MPKEETPAPVPAKKPRVSRRVKWTQPGSTENPASTDTVTPQRDRPESWGDAPTSNGSGNDSGNGSGGGSNSNDEQLRRDKPPHWG